ncbi:hypothetical protein PENTCL1PPCAC_26613 [Pristionchus entomophagus]|uniref:Secreted protein n=1 Tax=Pristionchus entomophagus TaxID=358040 RepID=A0AAV5UDI4_9BILA|nr:hypothetical protein PENTCL1PPCAC_26613 [Pristionchus entomophagus]
MRLSTIITLAFLVSAAYSMSYRGVVRNRQISRFRFNSEIGMGGRRGGERGDATPSITLRTTPPPFTVLPGFWSYLSGKAPPTDPTQFVRYYPVWKRIERSP